MLLELDARLPGSRNCGNHHLPCTDGIQLGVLAIEIVSRQMVQTLDAVPLRLRLREHIDYRVETMLQCQRNDSVTGVLVRQIKTRTCRTSIGAVR